MGEQRDPESDQPLPRPGGVPVQAVLIEALKLRMEFGLKKYGRPLETHNGRDPLRDMWEEMLDMVSYFTQFVLEQGVELPGLEQFTRKREPESPAKWRGPSADLYIYDEAALIPSVCGLCNHEPHVPAGCLADAPGGRTNCMCGVPEQAPCSQCRHGSHPAGRCASQSLAMPCACTNEDRPSRMVNYRDML